MQYDISSSLSLLSRFLDKIDNDKIVDVYWNSFNGEILISSCDDDIPE